MLRDTVLHEELLQRFKPGCSWIDIGAGNGEVTRDLGNLLEPSEIRCFDVKVTSGGATLPWVEKFLGTGENLRQKFKNSRRLHDPYDFSLFNFVLHHAAHNTDGLLHAAAALSKCIVIQEDLNEEWDTFTDIKNDGPTVASLLRAHDKRAVYYSLNGWRQKLQGLFPSASIYVRRHPPESTSDTQGYHVPRAILIVSWTSNAPE